MFSRVRRGVGAGRSLLIGSTWLVWSFLSLWPAPAHAAPNTLCPGTCDVGDGNSGQACGAATDCEEGVCRFSTSCLPGHEVLVPLIQRVVPEGPGGLNDPRVGWSCGLLTCEPRVDHLAVRSTWGSTASASKDFALTPGRYLLLADLAAEDRTWGLLSIASGVLEAWGDPVVGTAAGLAGDWERVSLYFEVPTGHSGPLQMRLHGDGPGKVALRRVVVLQLVDRGVYLRVTAIDDGGEGREVGEVGLGLAALRVRVPDVDGAHELTCGADACRVGRGNDAGLAASDWLDLSALADSLHTVAPVAASTESSRRNRMTVGFELLACGDDGCVPRSNPLEVTFELAWAKDPAAVLWRGTRVVHPARVGIVLPFAPMSVHPFALQATFVQDVLVSDLAEALESPSTFKVGTTTAPLDRYDLGAVDPRAHEVLTGLGLNVASWFESNPSATTRAAAKAAGLVNRVVVVPDVLASYVGDFDLEAIEDHVRATLALDRSPLGADLEGCTAQTCIARLDHTFRLYQGEKSQAAFVVWLAQQNETAEALGLTDLALASTLSSWPPPPIPSEVRAARLQIRQVEFAFSANAQALSKVKAVLAERGPGQEANPKDVIAAGLSTRGRSLVELRTAAEEGHLSALFATAATGPEDDCEVSRIAAHAQYHVSIAEPWREGAEARGESFALAVYIPAGRAELSRVLVEHAARGLDWFLHDGYGPSDTSLSDAYGGLGEASRDWMTQVRNANGRLTDIEPWLTQHRRQSSPFVILAPESDGLVTGDHRPVDSDALGWFAALSHSARPVEFMLESDIAQGFLEHPVITRRLLVVTRKHISQAAWNAIERWVEAGNTLVLGPDLASHDEYGQVVPDRTSWLGAVVGDTRRGGTTLRWSGALGVSSVLVPGEWREVLALIGTPIALSSDDRPVVVRVPRGRGRVIVSGVPLGATYRVAESGCDARRPASLPRYTKDFSAVLREAMTSLTGTTTSIKSDDPRVSVTRLTTEGGRPFVLVIPWLGTPEPVSIHIGEAAGCDSVRDEVEGVELPMTFGTLFTTLDGPAILTWDEDGCVEVVEEQPEVAEPTPPKVVDDGCAGGGQGLSLLGFLVTLALGGRVRRRAYR